MQLKLENKHQSATVNESRFVIQCHTERAKSNLFAVPHVPLRRN